MRPSEWLSLPSALIYLAIAASAVLRSTRSPMAPPLARTTAALFAYETFELVKHLDEEGSPHWQLFQFLECAAASLVAPTTAALVLTFLGERRRLMWLVVVGATYFSAASIACLVAAVVRPEPEQFLSWWAIAVLGGLVPEFAYLGALLWRHARRENARERARTQILTLALALGAGGASTDLVAIAAEASDEHAFPRLAVFGLVGAALLLAALAFRFDFLEGVRGLVVVNSIAIVALVVLLHAIVVSVGGSAAVTATVGVTITGAALATLRPIVLALAEERDRMRHLATMGRFSAQMAHDLRNPLAAIRGAAQFLAEEKRAGRSLDDQTAFVELILEQTDRLGKVVNEYQRVGRAEAIRAPTDIPALLRGVADGARVSWPSEALKVTAPEPLEAKVDRDLVAQALENLVRNAREAMGEAKGDIEILARRVRTTLEIAVADRGPGMDARTKERALDEFFTTKATGSGLGLAFVSRVAEAHGGRVTIESVPGVGTTVTMLLPDP